MPCSNVASQNVLQIPVRETGLALMLHSSGDDAINYCIERVLPLETCARAQFWDEFQQRMARALTAIRQSFSFQNSSAAAPRSDLSYLSGLCRNAVLALECPAGIEDQHGGLPEEACWTALTCRPRPSGFEPGTRSVRASTGSFPQRAIRPTSAPASKPPRFPWRHY